MKCKICGAKIQGKQYTGLGELEKVCSECGMEIIKSKIPQMKENYVESHHFLKGDMRLEG